MKKIISIDGMACEHCASTVKTALEELAGVKTAKVEFKKNSATIKFSDNVSDDAIKTAVTEAGFTVTGIESK